MNAYPREGGTENGGEKWVEERVEGGGTRPRPLIRRSSVTRWASRRGANRAASRYGRPRGGGEVAYRECGYRSSAVSLETRRWLLDFPSPFRFSTARGFRPRAFIRHGVASGPSVAFVPRFAVHEILADRLVIDAVTAHALFFRAGNRAERIGWREMDSRIPPEGVRFERWCRQISTVFSIGWNGRFLDFSVSSVYARTFPLLVRCHSKNGKIPRILEEFYLRKNRLDFEETFFSAILV